MLSACMNAFMHAWAQVHTRALTHTDTDRHKNTETHAWAQVHTGTQASFSAHIRHTHLLQAGPPLGRLQAFHLGMPPVSIPLDLDVAASVNPFVHGGVLARVFDDAVGPAVRRRRRRRRLVADGAHIVRHFAL